MKAFITSAVIVVVLISGWLIFFSYSEACISDYKKVLRENIIPSAEAEDWDKAYEEICVLSENWHKYKKISLFFLDTDAVNEIDYSMAKSEKYVKACDVSNSTGEMNSMIEQLTFLNSNDKISIENVF